MSQLVRMFGFGLMVLSFCWACYGLFASGNAYDETITEFEGLGFDSAAVEEGAAIGSGLSFVLFLCTSSPLFLVGGLMAYLAQRSITSEKRHSELMTVKGKSKRTENEILALRRAQIAINQKRYRDAKRILKKIDYDPKAQQWLLKLRHYTDG